MKTQPIPMVGPQVLTRFQRLRRLVLFAMICAAAAVLLFFDSWFGDGWLHEFVEAFGVAMIGAAIVGRLWSTLYIGGRKGAELVTRGPFSLTRNPLYVFSAVGAVGIGAQTGSIVVGLIFGLLTVLAFHVVIEREERFLREQFGEAYDAYCTQVPRFWPRLSGFHDVGEVRVDPKRLYSTLIDGLVFFAAVPVFEGIEWIQESGYLPTYFYLP